MRLPRAAAVALAVCLIAPGVAMRPAVARDAPPSFADLAAQLLPGVVNVSTSQTIKTADNGDSQAPQFPGFPPGSPFEQFFRDFMQRQRQGQGQDQGQGNDQDQGGDQDQGDNGGQQDQPQPQAPARKLQSLGSGFIIDPSGIIVTNNHVIEGADEITVTLQDGTSLKAKLLGRDEKTDIALLQVTPPKGKTLTAVQFGDSDTARVGDWVLAIGDPFGLGGTVTAGIVSARGRDINQGPYDDFIQTDAAINRGNSGGPLFNMDGKVVGINTAIYSPSGGSIGIGFSIPSDLAKNVVAQLRNYGHAKRGWLGVRIQAVTPDIADSIGLKDASGAMVAGVNDPGPAAKAGLKPGDVVLSFNGEPVKEMRNLPRIVAETEIGKEVPVVIWRNGAEQTIQVTVAEMPDDVKQASAEDTTPAAPAAPKSTALAGLGVQIAPISPSTRSRYQIAPDQKGVVITGVKNDSVAAQRGLQPGNVIMEVQQEPVGTTSDVEQKLSRARAAHRKSVLLLVQTQDGMRFVPLPVS
jgi:serine protease Do